MVLIFYLLSKIVREFDLSFYHNTGTAGSGFIIHTPLANSHSMNFIITGINIADNKYNYRKGAKPVIRACPGFYRIVWQQKQLSMNIFIRSSSCLFTIILAVSVLLYGCRQSGASEETGNDSFRIVGYVFGNNDNLKLPTNAGYLTHINYAFANVSPDGDVVLEHERDSVHLKRLTQFREQHPHLNILLSIGGWSWSDYFSDAALTDSSRQRFARSAVELLEKYDLDGIDIDWEYPGQPGEDNMYRPEDRENFTLLLKTVREHLDRFGKSRGRTGSRRYLLTIAAGADAEYLEHTDMAAVHPHLDFVNLMTYDFHGPWTDHAGHHANLHPPDGYPEESAASLSVNLFMDAGVPSQKLVLGVPFYGRGWADVDFPGDDIYHTYGTSHGSYSYDSLYNHYIDRNGYVRYWDETAGSPFLWNADSSVIISYEDEESLRYKSEYVREQQLGGIMYWEHSHNHEELLLQTIHHYLNES